MKSYLKKVAAIVIAATFALTPCFAFGDEDVQDQSQDQQQEQTIETKGGDSQTNPGGGDSIEAPHNPPAFEGQEPTVQEYDVQFSVRCPDENAGAWAGCEMGGGGFYHYDGTGEVPKVSLPECETYLEMEGATRVVMDGIEYVHNNLWLVQSWLFNNDWSQQIGYEEYTVTGQDTVYGTSPAYIQIKALYEEFIEPIVDPDDPVEPDDPVDPEDPVVNPDEPTVDPGEQVTEQDEVVDDGPYEYEIPIDFSAEIKALEKNVEQEVVNEETSEDTPQTGDSAPINFILGLFAIVGLSLLLAAIDKISEYVERK